VIGYGWGGSGGGNGKLTSIAYPSGAQVNYLYDATGRVTGITLNPVNASGSGTDSGVTLTVLSGLAYTGANQPRAWTWGDGVPYQRSFDRNGRLVSYPLGNPAGGGAVRTLSYDYASRIIGYSHAGAGALDQSFAYDGLDRLIDANQGGTLHGYGYDATGNRIQRKVGAQLFVNGVSATSNRLTTVQDGSGTTTLGYDAAGNIVSDAIGSYTYSARGRMSAATLGGGTVQYRYNALEQRVSKTGPAALVPTGASYYAYDEAGRLIGEYDADGVPRYETIYLGDTPVAVITQTRSGSPVTVQTQVAFIYADHIDTPRVIARSGDHGIVWRWDQAEAFGATPADDNPDGLGSFTFNQRFPGQVFDAETGLHQNWNREYNARLGRYIQSDPIGLAGGINTFAYVEGNPLSLVDPKGEQAQSGRYSKKCGRCIVIYDSDQRKGPHTHWQCPGQPQGCVKKDGTPCDGSAPPLPEVAQCLRDWGRVPQDYQCPPERSMWDRMKDILLPPPVYDPREDRMVPGSPKPYGQSTAPWYVPPVYVLP